ncbi:MAG TPA: right-handed parallel beta-helix repeat-containing protein, partial [Pirellulales bacterium]|nr:right-handed parallel beta-helix repeat-containing protein [Pirellulales bacterium]
MLAVGPQSVIFSASAPSAGSAESIGALLDVVPDSQAAEQNTSGDNDTPALSLSIPNVTMIPGTPSETLTGTVTRNTPTTYPLTVTLASLNSAAASIVGPTTITIPAGVASATFTITAVDAFSTSATTLQGAIVAAANGFASATSAVSSQTVNAIVQYNPPVPAVEGDVTKPRPQGELIVYANQIADTQNSGILVEDSAPGGVPGDNNTNLIHQGGLINTPTLNSAQLVDGVVIINNLIYGVGGSGIRFQGDPSASPAGSVPFGRIVNNTIYGGDSQAGIGIIVANRASPTMLNNLLVNLSAGVLVDASSNAVLGENLFQNDLTNSNVGTGSFPIVIGAATPSQFINPSTDPSKANFYLQPNSQAIDSSINSLQDRTQVTSVTGPIGIPPSPIIAPAYDLFGQLRVDDPAVANFPGLGNNVFIDRGAVELADHTGPTAVLLAPVDNNQIDLDRRTNIVLLRGQNLSEFTIQLNDGVGSGIDDSTVAPYAFTDVAAGATGTSMGVGGQTITVIFNGVTRTFEFTDSALPAGDPNTPIIVNGPDNAATLAAKAVATIDGGSGFNNASVATAIGTRIRFAVGVTASSGGGELTSGVTSSLDLREDGKLLKPGVDYTFAYDNNNHIIRLISASGVWPNGHQYDIYLDNGTKFDPFSSPPAPMTIMDRAGNALQANAADGYTHFRLLLANLTNTPPVINAPTTTNPIFEYQPTAPTSVTFSNALGDPITVLDVDSAGGNETVTLSSNQGTFTVANINGVTVNGNGTGTLIITGPLGDPTTVPALPGIDTALDGLVFTPNLNFPQDVTQANAVITIDANDNGESPPPARQTIATILVPVIAVNDPPSDSVPASSAANPITTPEDDPLVFGAAAPADGTAAGAITVSDPDLSVGGPDYNNPAYLFEETVTLSSAAAGNLGLTTASAVTFVNGSTNNSTTLDFTGTLQAINQALAGLTFTESREIAGSVTITFTTNDLGNIGVGPPPTYANPLVPLTGTATVFVNVVQDNDAPVLDTTDAVHFASIQEDSGTGLPGEPGDSGSSVLAMLQSATGDAPPGPSNIITLLNTDESPKYGIAITAQNVSTYPDGSAGGAWQFSLDGGKSWANFPTVANSNALLLDGADLVRFLPNPEFSGTAAKGTAPSLTFNAWDQTYDLTTGGVDVHGTTVDLTKRGTGLSWPFSVGSTAATLDVTPDNDAPTLAVDAAAPLFFKPVHEDAGTGEPGEPTDPGATVQFMLTSQGANAPAAGVVVPHAEDAQIGIAATGLNDQSIGTWSYSLDGGKTWNNFPTLSTSNALLLDQNDWVRFLPKPELSGTAAAGNAPSITFVGWDETYDLFYHQADTHGSLVDLTKTGTMGSTPFSNLATPATATLDVTPDNDFPTLDTTDTVFFNTILEDAGSGGSEPADGGQTVLTMLSSAGPTVGSIVHPHAEGTAANGLANPGIAVTAATGTSDGVWQYFNATTKQWVNFPTVSLSNALLLDGNDQVRFLPNQEFNTKTAAAPSLSFIAWDETYDLTTGGPDPDQTTVDLTKRQGGVGSWPFSDPTKPATAAINVTADNDAPTLTTSTVALAAIPEDAGSGFPGEASDNGFQISASTSSPAKTTDGLASYIQMTAADAKLGIAVTGATGTSIGTWEYSLDDKSWVAFPTVATSAALLLDGGDYIRFLPNPEASGTGTNAPTLTFHAWDQTYDLLTGKIDAASTATPSTIDLSKLSTDTSGSSPFSSTTATASLPVTPDNDAPTLSQITITLAAIPEDAGSGGKEATDPGFQISTKAGFLNDITLNAEGAKLGVAITGATGSAIGAWQYSLDGTTWISFPAVSTSKALLLDGNDYIRFLPNPEASGTGTNAPTLTFHAWDQTYDLLTGKSDAASTTTPSTIDLTNLATDTSGSSPFSAATATASMGVTPDNDAPTLTTGAIMLTAIPEDAGTGFPGEAADPGFQISSTTNGLANFITLNAEGAKLGVAITGATGSAIGAWQYSLDGTTWIAFPAVSTSKALLLDGSDYIRFLPKPESSGTATNAPTLTFHAWDQTYDLLTGKIDAASTSTPSTIDLTNLASDTSGSSPFSTATATASLNVTPDNDAPTLKAATYALPSLPEDAGSGTPGEAADPGLAISAAAGLAGDITLKAEGAKLGIALTGITQTANGSWQVSFDGGKTWALTLDPATLGLTKALLLDGSDWLRFLPNQEFSGTAAAGTAPSLTFYAWDQTYDALTGGFDAASTATKLSTVDLTGVAADTSGSLPFSSAAATATMDIIADNDAPTLSTTAITLTPIPEDAGSLLPAEAPDPGFQISALTAPTATTAAGFGSYITLNAADAKLGIAVTGVTQTSGGQWQVSFNGGLTWPVTIDPTTDRTKALLLDGSDYIRFLPNKEFNGTALKGTAPTISFVAWDQTYDAGTKMADVQDTTVNLNVTGTGGSTPFSTATAVASMDVTPDNDAPVLTQTAITLTPIPEDAGSGGAEAKDSGFLISALTSPTATTANGFGSYITLKAEGAKLGIAVTGVTQTANGSWQVSFDGGASWPLTIASTTSVANALLLDGNDKIRFLPNQEFSATGASAPTLSFVAWDETYDTITKTVDLPSTASQTITVNLTSAVNDTSGSLPFSSATATATLAVNPDNDAPVLASQNVALASIPEDAGSGLPGEAADPGFQISSATAGVASDITLKAEGAKLGIAVTGLTQTANGSWQVSFNGGVNWTTITSSQVGLTKALLLDGSDFLRFLPNKEWSGTGANAPSLTFYAWDQTYDIITGKIDSAS